MQATGHVSFGHLKTLMRVNNSCRSCNGVTIFKALLLSSIFSSFFMLFSTEQEAKLNTPAMRYPPCADNQSKSENGFARCSWSTRCKWGMKREAQRKLFRTRALFSAFHTSLIPSLSSRLDSELKVLHDHSGCRTLTHHLEMPILASAHLLHCVSVYVVSTFCYMGHCIFRWVWTKNK